MTFLGYIMTFLGYIMTSLGYIMTFLGYFMTFCFIFHKSTWLPWNKVVDQSSLPERLVNISPSLELMMMMMMMIRAQLNGSNKTD